MDLLKTKIYLDKLNREFGRMSKDPDNIARIDVDIMASYVRELYDALLSEAAEPASKSETPPPRKSAPPVRVEPVVEIPPVAPPPPLPVVPPPPVVVVEPPPPPLPVVEEKPFPKAEPVIVHKPAHTPHATGADLETLFEEKQVRELSDKLSEMPVADLKRAIALNDRLLLTRELFGGDGQAFENTIGALNGFGNFGDARAYLVNNCVSRYHWTDKKRLEVAKDFIKLVRRRYK